MPDLTLTEEQAKVLAGATEAVRLVRPDGRVLATVKPEENEAFFEEMRRRRAAPRVYYTTDQVQARMAALQEEWDRTGGFDMEYAMAFLARLDQTDPGRLHPGRPT